MLLPLLLIAIGCFVLERLNPGLGSSPKCERAGPSRPGQPRSIGSHHARGPQLGNAAFELVPLFHLSPRLSDGTGGVIGYLVSTFVFYWWHRWRHEVDWLWRGFHQIHHSPPAGSK